VEHFYSLLAAVLLDQVIGEFSFAHPLVGFGNLASQLELVLNKQESANKKILGAAAVLISILPFVGLTIAITLTLTLTVTLKQWAWIFDALVLYFAIGTRSLVEHATAVSAALKQDDLVGARLAVSKIVSRETSQMQAADAARAAIESVLENGNDAIFAPIFWFLLLGAPGAVLLRLSNTLDAMWGYKNDRYLHFGWAAARLDDVLMFIPARLTALTYALCGHAQSALHCWWQQGRQWYSPNAGPVMASGAGALQVSLGGDAVYGGKLKERPALGCGKEPEYQDIDRANKLVWRCLIVWIAIVFLKEIL
jgi:adenosylcobinamide-phosphate synthase